MAGEKKTERMTIWMPESLKVELMHLAADDERALGEYIVLALSRYAYGHSRKSREICDVANSGDTQQ
jgi:hypothetical protein